MTREQRSIVADHLASLSDDDLRYLGLRLNEQLVGDLAECLNLMSTDPRLDEVFKTATSAWDVYDYCDKVKEQLSKECKKRSLSLKYEPQLV